MALRSEVNDGARLVITKQITHEFPIGDVPVDKPVAPVSQDRLEITDVPGVGEVVQINNGSTFGGQPLEDKIGAYKPGSSRDKNRLVLQSSNPWSEHLQCAH